MPGNPFVSVFDVETTGKDPETARIVSAFVGALDREGELVEGTSYLVNPGIPIPPEVIEIHGITNERVQEFGMPAEEGVKIIMNAVAAQTFTGCPLVIMNAPYDLTVLDREGRRHGMPGLAFKPDFVVDPYVIDKSIEPYRKGGRKLADLAKRWNIPVDGELHDAKTDCITTGRLAILFLNRPKMRTMTPHAMHASQVEQKRSQMDGYREWLTSQGKPTDDVWHDWPIRPFDPERPLA